MDGDQKLDPYAQVKQDFIQHFFQMVKVLTEDGMTHLETGDGIAWLKEVLGYSPIEFDLKVTACIDLEKLLGLPFIRELKSQNLALNETIERTSLRFLWTLGLLIIFHNGMQPFSELWPC
uniref:Uncharacterized protein n=1 Tax=Neovison vison TaxID=452646 RepID=A0A8C7CA84_NEOVI